MEEDCKGQTASGQRERIREEVRKTEPSRPFPPLGLVPAREAKCTRVDTQ